MDESSLSMERVNETVGGHALGPLLVYQGSPLMQSQVSKRSGRVLPIVAVHKHPCVNYLSHLYQVGEKAKHVAASYIEI